MRESAIKFRGLLLRTRSEDWLFERAIRGDAVAFSEVYRRYHGRVYAFCLSRLLDQAAAEEAAQETFVRFLQADATTIESPRPWLFGVARNVCLDLGRQRQRAMVVEQASDLFGAAIDSHEELSRKEQGRNIILALRRMRPRYRTALVLRELHGLSSIEMAEALGSTPGAVDTMVCRARDAFGRAYAEVSDLPDACATAYPLIYRRYGSGLNASESARLDAHLDTCDSCRRELKWAGTGSNLAAAIPLLTTVGASSEYSGLTQLLANLDPALAINPYAAVPAAQHIWGRVAIALALTAAIALPASMMLDRVNDSSSKAVSKAAPQISLSLGPAPRRLADEDEKDEEVAERPQLVANSNQWGWPLRHTSSARKTESVRRHPPRHRDSKHARLQGLKVLRRARAAEGKQGQGPKASPRRKDQGTRVARAGLSVASTSTTSSGSMRSATASKAKIKGRSGSVDHGRRGRKKHGARRRL